tara:strand:- start:118 stop:957 length:840 start_codon:yes stop_codon:yes gene_type:complete
MKKKTKIIGILLFRDEDVFIKKCILGVIDFVDQLIILDNNSKDNSTEIVKKIKKIFNKKIIYKKIKKISVSHKFIEKYAGKKIWVMKVDADEIYDKKRLKIFRKEILKGKYDNIWVIKGAMLNVFTHNEKNKKISGFFSPPSQNSCEIYNFNLINFWKDCKIERLHYGKIQFKKGCQNTIKVTNNWFKSSYRCLHYCFERRSTNSKNIFTLNKAPFEIVGSYRLIKSQVKFTIKILYSYLLLKRNIINLIKIVFIKKFISIRKIEQYSRGKLHKDIIPW